MGSVLDLQIDQVTDKLEEIMQKFYIYNIQTVSQNIIEFAKNLVRACEHLCLLMAEFENFKRSKKIRDYIIKLNDVEEECDRLYLKCMRDLTIHSADVLETISCREIFECFEACADACEHVGECVGTAIMKNT